jgi:hypothetical protein
MEGTLWDMVIAFCDLKTPQEASRTSKITEPFNICSLRAKKMCFSAKKFRQLDVPFIRLILDFTFLTATEHCLQSGQMSFVIQSPKMQLNPF